MNVEQVARVVAFCLMPKASDTLAKADAWVLYTGDGWKLVDGLRRSWEELQASETRRVMPDIFITGPDNLMLPEDIGEHLNASHFAEQLIQTGVIPREKMFVNATQASLNTHRQAQTLIAMAEKHPWAKVALFTSGYHSVRAWLTTITRIPDDMSLLVIPAPQYGLRFDEPNEELAGQPSAWQLFNNNMLARIAEYQEKGFCASWEEADEYLRLHGF
ncbi:YdcF family protein [Candidatus Nomurabacteria bacterium]|nr:YdcF family protein [Candidatus Nomurabacteria bacterium]